MRDENDSPVQSTSAPFASAMTALEGDARIDALAPPLARVAGPVSSGPAASVLRGDWMGHALHPLLTDFPLGCWLSAGLLDLFGGRGARRSAQRLVGLGLLAVPPTVASGLSEWSTIREPGPRRVGVVHALGNVVVAGLYYRSWRARRRGHHVRGVLLAMAGGGGAWVTGYLGGHLSFARAVGTGGRGDLSAAGSEAGTSPTDLLDLTDASHVIGVPAEQVLAMVDEGLLVPVVESPELRFREADARAVRLLGG